MKLHLILLELKLNYIDYNFSLDDDELVVKTNQIEESRYLLPSIHKELILEWLTTNKVVEYYNRFRHPNDKWEECEVAYWNVTTKYRLTNKEVS